MSAVYLLKFIRERISVAEYTAGIYPGASRTLMGEDG